MDDLQSVVDALCGPLEDFALMMLHKHGAMLPVGMVLDATGETVLVAAVTEDEDTAPDEALVSLIPALRAAVREHKAVAMAFVELVRVRLAEAAPLDAVKITVETPQGAALLIYIPYRKRWLRTPQREEPIIEDISPALIDDWS